MWERNFLPKRPDQCLDNRAPQGNRRISLNNLSGAFVLLLAGYAISLTAAIMEQFIVAIGNREVLQ